MQLCTLFSSLSVFYSNGRILTTRLRELANYGLHMPKDEIHEVLDQISSVKQQSQNVGEYLQYERESIEKQLSELVEKVKG